MGASIITAALIISPWNPFAPIVEPWWKATFQSGSIESQFISQMTKELQRDPKGDVVAGSQLQFITVDNVSSGKSDLGIPALKIDYTLHYQPSKDYKLSCYINRIIGVKYYGGFSYYGYSKKDPYQQASIKIY